jgi:hypothetical protein
MAVAKEEKKGPAEGAGRPAGRRSTEVVGPPRGSAFARAMPYDGDGEKAPSRKDVQLAGEDSGLAWRGRKLAGWLARRGGCRSIVRDTGSRKRRLHTGSADDATPPRGRKVACMLWDSRTEAPRFADRDRKDNSADAVALC